MFSINKFINSQSFLGRIPGDIIKGNLSCIISLYQYMYNTIIISCKLNPFPFAIFSLLFRNNLLIDLLWIKNSSSTFPIVYSVVPGPCSLRILYAFFVIAWVYKHRKNSQSAIADKASSARRPCSLVTVSLVKSGT